MAHGRADWSMLRGTVIGFAVCVLAAAGMLSASVYFKQTMEREYRANHARFRDASRQYLAVDEEERIIERFYPEFVRLHRAGLLGRERRLSWIETLRTAGDSIRIPELTYKLEAQAEAQPDFPLGLGGYTLYVSSMELDLGLLHEGDLLALLDALDAAAQGQYTVRSCDLRAGAEASSLDPERANVRARCTLDWLTVDLAGDRELTL